MCALHSAEDERINVTAKLGVPRPGGGSTKPAAPAGGSLTLRFQPFPDVPFTFFDVKARTRGAASAAAVRGCLFDPASRLAVFAELPVAATSPSGGALPAAAAAGLGLRLGAKYTTPGLSVGAVVNPAASQLQQAFVVGALGGCRCDCFPGALPVPALGPLQDASGLLGAPQPSRPLPPRSSPLPSFPAGCQGRCAAAGRPDLPPAPAGRAAGAAPRPPRLGGGGAALPAGRLVCGGLPARAGAGLLRRSLHRCCGAGALDSGGWAVEAGAWPAASSPCLGASSSLSL